MQSVDYKWFLENLQALYKQYGNAYIAIKNKSVIGVYSSYAEGVKTTAKTEELGSFIVQHCSDDISAQTVYIASMNFNM